MKVTMPMRGEHDESGSSANDWTKPFIHSVIRCWNGIIDALLSTTST